MKISQEDLAAQTGISQRQISRYETEANDPPAAALLSLARALCTSTDYLLGRTDDPRPKFEPEDMSEFERDVLTAMRRGDRAEAAKLILNN